MLHRIRYALHAGLDAKMSGAVEADETYIGGKARNMHKDAGAKSSTGPAARARRPSWACLSGTPRAAKRARCSKVRTFVLGTTKKKEIQPIIRENVEEGSHVYTDALKSLRRHRPGLLSRLR